MLNWGINIRCGNCKHIFVAQLPPLAPGAIWDVTCPRCKDFRPVTRAPSGVPPWQTDGEPEKWVTVKFAAEHYFRRSENRIREAIRDGEYEGVFPSYYDGRMWFIKLPEVVKVEVVSK